jgi:hypothetical protein
MVWSLMAALKTLFCLKLSPLLQTGFLDGCLFDAPVWNHLLSAAAGLSFRVNHEILSEIREPLD